MAAAFVHKSYLLHDHKQHKKIQDQCIETMLQGGKASLQMKFMKRGRGTCGTTLRSISTDNLSKSELDKCFSDLIA
jgi:hypothetical protein